MKLESCYVLSASGLLGSMLFASVAHVAVDAVLVDYSCLLLLACYCTHVPQLIYPFYCCWVVEYFGAILIKQFYIYFSINHFPLWLLAMHMFTFRRWADHFSRCDCSNYIPTYNEWELQVFHVLPTLKFDHLFHSSDSGRYVVVSHWSFNFHFLMGNDVDYLSTCPLATSILMK